VEEMSIDTPGCSVLGDLLKEIIIGGKEAGREGTLSRNGRTETGQAHPIDALYNFQEIVS